MFKLDFSEAFHYPMSSMSRFLVAGVVLPLAILAVPALTGVGAWLTWSNDVGRNLALIGLALAGAAGPACLLLGYGLRATREVARGNQELPAWTGWPGILLEGAAGMVLGLVLAGGPLALLGVLTVRAAHRYAGGKWDDILTALFLFVFTPTGLACLGAFLLVVLGIQFIAPLALMRLAVHRSLLAGLNPVGMAADLCRAPLDYLLFQAVVFGTGWVAHAALGFAPFLAPLGLPLNVYLQLLSAQLMGQYYRRHISP